MLNKKGLIWIQWMMCGTFASMVVASVFLTPSHRIRKAVEKCEATEYFTVDCESSIAGMSKAEVLDYIRDDDMSTGNKGKL